MTALPKTDTKYTALSLIPTIIGNTFAASLRTDISPQRKESSSTSQARNPFNLNFFDSAQCLWVRRWRLIGHFPILYNPRVRAALYGLVQLPQLKLGGFTENAASGGHPRAQTHTRAKPSSDVVRCAPRLPSISPHDHMILRVDWRRCEGVPLKFAAPSSARGASARAAPCARRGRWTSTTRATCSPRGCVVPH
jgi:hypothetical protein